MIVKWHTSGYIYIRPFQNFALFVCQNNLPAVNLVYLDWLESGACEDMESLARPRELLL